MLESILYAIAGGAVLGLASSWFLLAKGRIAGISGIVGGLLGGWTEDSSWRLTFLIGLLLGGALIAMFAPQAIVPPPERSIYLVAVAGLLVGYGTRLGNGCTSGHGICGLSRLSTRSLIATISFMFTGVIAATLGGLL